mgnify:FL=1
MKPEDQHSIKIEVVQKNHSTEHSLLQQETTEIDPIPKARHTSQKNMEKLPAIRKLKHSISFSYYPWTLQFLCQQYASSFSRIKPKTVPVTRSAYVRGNAQLFAEAVVGIQHRQAQIALPCQDAVKVSEKPRPILVLCDGAGSAAVSEQGSQATVQQLTRFCQSLEPLIKTYLDQNSTETPQFLVRLLIRHAIGILEDLAKQQRRSIRDFRCTLNMAIVGTQQILWLKVGDGEIIQEQIKLIDDKNEEATYLCLGQHNKGEFANQTQFIDDQLRLTDVHWGLLDTQSTTGIVLMSDGAAEKLVSTQRDRVAPLITQWLVHLRHEKLRISDFYQRFYAEDFLNRSTGDDRALALYSTDYYFPI